VSHSKNVERGNEKNSLDGIGAHWHCHADDVRLQQKQSVTEIRVGLVQAQTGMFAAFGQGHWVKQPWKMSISRVA
jgi:hypothetical protein